MNFHVRGRYRQNLNAFTIAQTRPMDLRRGLRHLDGPLERSPRARIPQLAPPRARPARPRRLLRQRHPLPRHRATPFSEQVAAFDRSPAQIAFAREHRAHPRVTYSVADAMALPLPAESFDVTVCGLGLNFVPDPARALDEFRRTTLPGGAIACFVWDYSVGARFIRAFWDVALEIAPESAQFDQGRRFEICKPEVLQKSFAAAHLESPELHALEINTRFENFDDYWKPFLLGQGSAPVYLRSQPTRIQNAIRDRLIPVSPPLPTARSLFPPAPGPSAPAARNHPRPL